MKMFSFDDVWQRLADQSVCEEIGGMEYSRVKREWVQWGRKKSLEEFIRERANPTLESGTKKEE
jgi:hypothetical protein